ncbi:hypothetical protein STENM327S_07132 [Streptomyces tendae]
MEGEHSLPLGMVNLDRAPAHRDTHLDPGDTLIAYSDGITEARDSAGTFYPLRERLQAHCADSAGPVPHPSCAFLEEDVARWGAGHAWNNAVLQPAGPSSPRELGIPVTTFAEWADEQPTPVSG